MPEYVNVDSFKLLSVDHADVLLSDEIKSSRRLLENASELPNAVELSFSLNSEEFTKTLHKRPGAFKEDVQFTTSDGSELDFEFRQEDYVSYHSTDKSFVLVFNQDSDKFEGVYFTDKINHFVARDGVMKIDSTVTELFPEVGRKLLSEANGIVYWNNCHSGQQQGLSALDIGFALGNVLLRNEGTSGSLQVMNVAVILANTIYERQMDVTLRVSNIFYALTPTDFSPSSCNIDMDTRLKRFETWRPKPSQESMWHLIDDCYGQPSGLILGIAYISGGCSNTARNVGVTQHMSDQFASDQYQTWATFAHEIGHNLAAKHSFEEGQGRTGGLMDYGYIKSKEINGELQFNTVYRKQEVCNKLQSAINFGCMEVGVGPNPTTQLTTFQESSVIELAENERDLKCFRHRNRILRTSDDGRSRELTVVFNVSRQTCKSECEKLKECSSFSLSDDGYCVLLTDAEVADLDFQASFSSFLCYDKLMITSESDRNVMAQKMLSTSVDDKLEAFKEEKQLEKKCCTSQNDQSLLGMNFYLEQSVSQDACFRRCVKTSKCEVASFDKTVKSCIFYNDAMYPAKTFIQEENINSLSCDRECLEVQVKDVIVNDDGASKSGGASIGIVFGVMGMILIVLAVGLFIRKRLKKPTPSGSTIESGEANIKHATL